MEYSIFKNQKKNKHKSMWPKKNVKKSNNDIGNYFWKI